MAKTNEVTDQSVIIIASGKGGVGKSLLSLVLADLFELNSLPLDIYQLDDQQRLEKAIGRSITTLDVHTLKQARREPTVITSVFDPFYRGLEAMQTSNRTLLLDVGATQTGNLIDYADLIDLDEDLVEFGLSGTVLIPAVAEPESLRQAQRTIELFSKTLPSMRLVFVENLRDGRMDDLSKASQAGEIYFKKLVPILKTITCLTMPCIEAGSWRAFEQNHCRVLDVGTMSLQDAIDMTGLSRPEAKLARGDVLAFFDLMERELSSILPFSGGDE